MKTLSSILFSLAALATGVATAQTVSVSPTSLNFSAQFGGPAVSQTLTITSTGGSTTIGVTPSQFWLSASPTSGSTPQTVTVTANPAGLPVGTYTDTNFRVLSVQGQTITIPVTMTVSSFTVSPQSLSFSYVANSGATPVGQFINLAGSGTFTANATTTSGGNWLLATPPNGTIASSGQISVVLNGLVLQTLAAGTYQGQVAITPGGSPALNIPVTLTVTPEPTVTVSPASVTLNYQIGGLNNQGAQQPVTLTSNSTTALAYAFGTPSVNPNPSGRNWIIVNPTNGTIPANGSTQSAISYDSTANLPAGSYSGTVPVGATGGQTSVSSLPVNLLVSSNPLLIVPTQALNFSYQVGGTLPSSQSVTAQSTAVLPSSATGQMPIVVTSTTASGGSWLSVTQGSNPATGTPFSVAANPASLLPGTYTGTITVAPGSGANAGNGPQTIAVTLIVANDPMIVASIPTTVPLIFPYQVGQAAPGQQIIGLTSSTGAPLNYTVVAAETACGGTSWLATSGATAGTTNSSFNVAVTNLSSLATGTCTGTLTVTATNPATGNPAVNSPLVIPVTLYVSNDPLLVVTPSSLSFSLPVGGSTATQQLAVTSTSSTSNLTFTVTESTNNGGPNWLTVGPLSGNTSPGNNIVTVSVSPFLLSAGTYTGTVTIASIGVADSPLTIPVTLQVTAGSISLSTTSLSFTATAGGANPAAQSVNVTSTGAALNFTAASNSGTAGSNWLSVTPTSGTTPGAISIAANASSLSPGVYAGTVVVTSPGAGNSPAVINVALTVNSGTISASPAPSAGLTFTQPAGGSAPAAQTITLTGTPGAINFTATGATASGGNWLTVTPATGSTPGTVTVSANSGTLAVGAYTGTLTITAPGATGSPLTYNVTLNVVNAITITATPASLTFGYTLNATAPPAQTVQIAAQGPPGVTIAVFPYTASATTTDGANWLQVTPATGNVPGSISVSVNPQGLAAGNYTGTVTVATGNGNGATSATVTVKLAVTAAPTPVIAAVSNTASGFIGAVSPGEEVSLFGTNFGPSTITNATPANGAFPTTLANTQVLFDGVAAPIIGVVSGQVNVMVPYGVSGRATTTVQVSYLGVASAGITYNVTQTVPGIYTLNQQGTGQGAIVNQTGIVNGASAPALKNSVVQIYMTGEGVTSPPSPTGQVAPTDGTGLNHPLLTVTATVGGIPATVQYQGSAPGIVYGVMQVNVVIPPNAPSGNVPIVVTVGTVNSQSGVTVALQ